MAKQSLGGRATVGEEKEVAESKKPRSFMEFETGIIQPWIDLAASMLLKCLFGTKLVNFIGKNFQTLFGPEECTVKRERKKSSSSRVACGGLELYGECQEGMPKSNAGVGCVLQFVLGRACGTSQMCR